MPSTAGNTNNAKKNGQPRRLHRIRAHLTSGRELTGPLQGIRVLDMSAVISGPWAASFLQDQGADVTKIEPPNAPDLTRTLGPGLTLAPYAPHTIQPPPPNP